VKMCVSVEKRGALSLASVIETITVPVTACMLWSVTFNKSSQVKSNQRLFLNPLGSTEYTKNQ
jgi:hypothetical protein